MAKKIIQAALVEGLVSPFPDANVVQPDTYSQGGGFQPALGILDVINAMPTEHGYMSFFGQTVELGSIPGETIIQDILVVRTLHGTIVLVALCPGGLYIRVAGNSNTVVLHDTLPTPSIAHLAIQQYILFPDDGFTWTKVLTGKLYCASPWRWWTYAVVKNKLYFYQNALGYIAELTSESSQKLIINQYNTTYIIGNYIAHTWTIEGNVDSTADEIGAQQQIESTELAIDHSYTMLHKAHIAAYAPTYWTQWFNQYIGQGSTREI
jgi:hypothetical protein